MAGRELGMVDRVQMIRTSQLASEDSLAGRPWLSAQSPGWVPSGSSVIIAGREIGGLVYVSAQSQGSGHRRARICRACIDPVLPVAPVGCDRRGDEMSLWPSYSEISQACRATYLDWLAKGRSDPSMHPGYVLLYLYGLERRFLIDSPSGPERVVILDEVMRLRHLLTDSDCVKRRLDEFIDIAGMISRGELSANLAEFREPMIGHGDSDLPLSLKMSLGRSIAAGEPLDDSGLFSWFMALSGKRLRLPALRCGEEFRQLFKRKFDARFPDGLQVRKPRRKLLAYYHAMSGEFGGLLDVAGANGSVVDIANLRQPIALAQDIVDAAMHDLGPLSRYLGRNPGDRHSIAAIALRPAELWSHSLPGEMNGVVEWINSQLAEGGLVTADDLMEQLVPGCAPRSDIQKAVYMADVLARCGIGMVPDPRISLRARRRDEPFLIFDLGGPVLSWGWASQAYHSALVEIAAATYVACAAGPVSKASCEALQAWIIGCDGLIEVERRYLVANMRWHLAQPPDLRALRGHLKVTDNARRQAWRALIRMIVHSDLVILPAKIAAAEEVYNAIGLDLALVYADFHAGGFPDGPVRVRQAVADPPGEPIPPSLSDQGAFLDAGRIAAIRRDTEQVSAILEMIFAADEQADIQTDYGPFSPVFFCGLGSRHVRLARQLIKREQWSAGEFEGLSATQGLMADGALETLNEWAFTKFDEALLENDGEYQVSPQVGAALRAEFAREGRP